MTVDIDELKAGGIIAQRQKNYFSIRIKIPQGNVTSRQLRKIAELSERYGKSYAHLTMRQGFEISFIHIDNIDKVREELKTVELTLGACGQRVRVIVSCQGDTICNYAIGDTQGLAKILDQRFYGRYGLPHKFKIGVTGCPNSCAKPQEHDIGLMAVIEPSIDEKECTGCGLCVEVCPTQAITFINEKPVIDKNRCFNDGRCIQSCSENAIKIKRVGWDLFIGGKWGRKPLLGQKLCTFISKEEVSVLVEKILATYTELANKRERLGELIIRIGLQKFKEKVNEKSIS